MRAITIVGVAYLMGCSAQQNALHMELAVDPERQTYPWPFDAPAWAGEAELAADAEEPDRSDEPTVAFECRLLRWPGAATSDEWQERLALIGLLDEDVAILGGRQLDALLHGARDQRARLLQAPRIVVWPQQCASIFIGSRRSTASSASSADGQCGPGTRIYLEATDMSPSTVTFRFALQATFALGPDGSPERCWVERETTLESGQACATLAKTVGSDDAHIVVVRATVLRPE